MVFSCLFSSLGASSLLVFLEFLEELCLLLLDAVLALSLGHLGAVPALGLDLLLGLLFGSGVSADSGMAVGVHGLNTSGCDSVLDVEGELALVLLFILVLEHGHVISYVLAKDVVTVHLSVELSSLAIVAGETLHAVGDVKATIS